MRSFSSQVSPPLRLTSDYIRIQSIMPAFLLRSSSPIIHPISSLYFVYLFRFSSAETLPSVPSTFFFFFFFFLLYFVCTVSRSSKGVLCTWSEYITSPLSLFYSFFGEYFFSFIFRALFDTFFSAVVGKTRSLENIRDCCINMTGKSKLFYCKTNL